MSVHWVCVATAAITHREHSVVPVPPVWNSPLGDDPAEVSCCNFLVDIESIPKQYLKSVIHENMIEK